MHKQGRGRTSFGIHETDTDIRCQAHVPGTMRASTRTLQCKCSCPAPIWLSHAFCPICDRYPCCSLYPCLLKALYSELLSKRSCFSWDNQSKLFPWLLGLQFPSGCQIPGLPTARGRSVSILSLCPLLILDQTLRRPKCSSPTHHSVFFIQPDSLSG